MHVGLVAHDLVVSEGRGLRRYVLGLTRALAAQGGAELVLFTREPLQPDSVDLPVRSEVWWGRREVLWEQLELPRRARALGIDVLHAPANRGLPRWSHCPRVLTRHDEIERMFPPDFPPSRRSELRRRYADWLSVRGAHCVVTVSERSRLDIEREWRLPSGRVRVLGEGVEESFFLPPPAAQRRAVRERLGLGGRFVLYVGGGERRKRLDTLLAAFAAQADREARLVLVGVLRGLGAEGVELLERLVAEGRVIAAGRLEDGEVRALLAECDLFVFPSRYEGFGLPVAEAMAAGAPVLCSDGGALPEIAGGAARLFPVGDEGALGSALAELLAAPALRRDLADRGRERAEAFRWERVAPRYLALYRELAA